MWFRTHPRLPRRLAVPKTGAAVSLGALRCLVGAALLADPPRLARLLGVDTVTARQTGWLASMVGGRDLALGVGSLLAVRRGKGLDSWLAAQALADGADAMAVAAAVRSRRVAAPMGAAVVVCAVVGAALAAQAALAGTDSPKSARVAE